MKKIKRFFAAVLLAGCFVITNSCPQTAAPGNSAPPGVFAASTPCDDVVKTLLNIPAETKCELMKWNLTLHQDPKSSAAGDFKLVCIYGIPKQGTKDFMDGAKTKELNGKWKIGKGTNKSADADIYKLNAENAPISLSFLKLDQNLLHLLDGSGRLIVGNGAWSYTLNRINPIAASSAKQTSKSTAHLLTDSPVVGVFDGRTPCIKIMEELNGVSGDGCQATKWRLAFYQDPKTHTPTTFQVFTIYVDKGDTKYTNTGKWMITRGTKTNPEAVVYELELDPVKSSGSLSLLKADDNILLFLDKEKNLMVGDINLSYTLNRNKKQEDIR